MMMTLKRTGSGRKVHYNCASYGTETIQWVSGDSEAPRIPQPKDMKFIYPGPFVAAGKLYTHWDALCVQEGPKRGFYLDQFGRKVFSFAERFPCFDSYDYMYENRFYRWRFLLVDGQLTRVYHTDQRPWICVTEDVGSIERDCLRELENSGFLDWCREA